MSDFTFLQPKDWAPPQGYANGIAVCMSGYGGPALAVKLGGTGDITNDRLWHHPKNTQRVGSGVIVGSPGLSPTRLLISRSARRSARPIAVSSASIFRR